MTILDRFAITGQAAIVTGAGRGLGAATAVALAEAGADVLISARTELERIHNLLTRSASRAPMDFGLPCGCGDLLCSFMHHGVIELAWDTTQHGEVCRAKHQNIDARYGCNPIHTIDRARLLDLDDRKGLSISRLNVLL